MPRVVLFKTKSEVNGTDAYIELFAQAGFEVQYIPVLQEEFHVDELSQLISEKKADWAGVVITSKRGAEGWVQATKRFKEASSSTNWKGIQLYTVGSTSLDYLSEFNPSIPEHLRLDTAQAIQAKSASALLPLILQWPSADTRPLILIRGDKSTNELQHGLKKAQRTYVETTVYSTTCRPSLKSDARALLEDIEVKKGETWLAFFSPSSAEMVLDHFPQPSNSSPKELWAESKIAAIGETTTQFLVQYGIKVHAVAKEPTAEGLVNAIRAYEESMVKKDVGV